MVECIVADLGLFSSMSLVLANPDHPVEIRTQMQQGMDEPNGVDSSSWIYTSSRSQTTISRYAEYQISSYTDVQNVRQCFLGVCVFVGNDLFQGASCVYVSVDSVYLCAR